MPGPTTHRWTARLATVALGLALALLCGGLRAAAGAPAALPRAALHFVPGELVVRFRDERFGHLIHLPSGIGVARAEEALRRNPHIAYAVPNTIASASSALPDDPGTFPGARTPGGWVRKQWNFLPCGSLCGGRRLAHQSAGGINAVGAWQNLRSEHRRGAAGVRIAVLDTGIAYRRYGSQFRRSPDFAARQFLPGYDFVQKNPLALDMNGHGTHVAGTIAENTDNGVALTGLAYRAKLMPIRVLDANAHGDAANIAAGIRFAATHGAQVINMSFNFSCGDPALPVAEASSFARSRGVVLVAAVGNNSPVNCVSMPATTPGVIAVGATTEGGCPATYSRVGPRVDLVAPGGGPPAASCPSQASRPIYQLTLRPGSFKQFWIPGVYLGTSMAAAHVSGAAAMVIASGVLGRAPSPDAVLARLEQTARSVGPADQFGAGLIDVARATSPAGQRGRSP